MFSKKDHEEDKGRETKRRKVSEEGRRAALSLKKTTKL